jgi:hypothetical protein
MSTAEERLKILSMVAEGKITAEEGARLLSALQVADHPGGSAAQSGTDAGLGPGEARYLRIRVCNCESGRDKINVNIPMNLVSVALRMGARFAPDVDGVELEDIVKAIRQGARGKIVDVTDDEAGERVEIFVE